MECDQSMATSAASETRTGMRCCQLFLMAATTLAASLWAAPAKAQPEQLRIVEKVWGFDGNVANGQFNPFTIQLDNLTDDLMEAEVELSCVIGQSRPSGGQLQQTVFMGPHSNLWVQFYPYISKTGNTWTVTVKTADGRTFRFDEIDQANSTWTSLPGNSSQTEQPARHVTTVILDNSRMAERMPTSIKHMQEEIFPPYAPATSGLALLFMDHVPDWDVPRQQAFLSWLKCGGTLHLLADKNGQRPRFTGDMAVLNQPFAYFRVGVGSVTVEDYQRQQLSRDVVESIQVAHGLIEKKHTGETDPVEDQYNYSLDYGSSDPNQMDEELMRGLRSLTQPQHAWWLIMLLSFVYVGMIFPGCWLLSRSRKVHFLAAYGGIAGLSVIFSLLFLLIGRRGYGEETALTSIALAKAEDDTHWNVFEWNSLFVTSGDQYTVSAADQQSLYSTANSDEAARAVSSCGSNGRINTLIPPFSAQTFVSHRRVSSTDWQLKINNRDVGNTSLQSLTLDFGSEFPTGPECIYYALFLDRLYELRVSTKTPSRLYIAGSARSLETLRRNDWDEGSFGYGQMDEIPDEDRFAAFYQTALKRLICRSILNDGFNDLEKYHLPTDRIRLFVFAEKPAEFAQTVSSQSADRGRVLYVRDLLLNPDGAAPIESESL